MKPQAKFWSNDDAFTDKSAGDWKSFRENYQGGEVVTTQGVAASSKDEGGAAGIDSDSDDSDYFENPSLDAELGDARKDPQEQSALKSQVASNIDYLKAKQAENFDSSDEEEENEDEQGEDEDSEDEGQSQGQAAKDPKESGKKGKKDSSGLEDKTGKKAANAEPRIEELDAVFVLSGVCPSYILPIDYLALLLVAGGSDIPDWATFSSQPSLFSD